jgi:hypothetical protein
MCFLLIRSTQKKQEPKGVKKKEECVNILGINYKPEAHLSLYRSPDYSYASLYSIFNEA